MNRRTFAPWVEPIAAQLREGRAEIAALARTIPPGAWGRPSPNGRWTCRDLLAHLATGDWALQSGLRRVVADQPLRIADFADVDTVNARNVAERAGRSTEQLIAEVEAEGEDTQQVLSRLRDEHEQYAPEDVPLTLGNYLRRFPQHDRQHLEELRTALNMGQ